MKSLKPNEKRGSVRRHLYHATKMKVGGNTPPRECLVLDISDKGVRLYVGGFEVPDKFVLILSDVDIDSESTYEVIWRRGQEVGARFVSFSSISTELK